MDRRVDGWDGMVNLAVLIIIWMDFAWLVQNVYLFLFLSKEVSENKKLTLEENIFSSLQTILESNS